METATKVTPHRRRLRRRRIPRPQLRLRLRRQRLPRPATPHPVTRVLIRPIRCLRRRPTETLSMELNGERLPKARMASVSSTPRRTRRNAGTAASTSLTKQGMDTGPARLFPGRSIPATGVNSGSNSMGMAYPAKNEFETNPDIQPDVIHPSRAVPNPVVRAMTQPMNCPGTVRSHVWLYTSGPSNTTIRVAPDVVTDCDGRGEETHTV